MVDMEPIVRQEPVSSQEQISTMQKVMEKIQAFGQDCDYFLKAAGPKFGGIRSEDETGHSVGIGTIAKEFVIHPIRTEKAVEAFMKTYREMKDDDENVRMEMANYDATKAFGNPAIAEAMTAYLEQSRALNLHQHESPAGEKGRGDMRTQAEIDLAMAASKMGRERAMEQIIANGE